MKSHKKPPQGTHRIDSQKRQERIESNAEKLVDDLMCYRQLSHHKLWHKVAQNEPDPEAWKQLEEEVGRRILGRAYRYWRIHQRV